MRCPACKAVLVTIEYRLIEVDCCTACGGTWLDSGELEFICKDAGACDEFMGNDTAPPADSAPRACPICSVSMRTRHTNGQPPIRYERCDKHGLWLDKGELEQVTAKGAAAPGGPSVHVFLRETFGKKFERE